MSRFKISCVRECVFSAPRSRREPGRRERGSARGGRRGGAASRGQGGPGVTGGQGRKISFSNLLPSVPPRPRFFFLLEALGCESRFLSSRQNGLCVSGGRGEGGEGGGGGDRVYFSSWFPPSPGFCGQPRRAELGAGCPPQPSARPGSPRESAGGTARSPQHRCLTQKHRRGPAAGPG